MFLPVSEAVRELSGIDARVPHRVVPNFIGELPPPPPAEEPRLRELPTEPYILYFGDVTEDKGVGWLLDVYRELEGAPPLVLIGRQELEGAGEVPGVIALERMPHPIAIEALRRSAFTVAPSLLPESFGIVALEAAAAGKPTIAADHGGLARRRRRRRERVPGRARRSRGRCGSPSRRLIDDPALRERMGQAASRHAELFGPDVVVPEFEAAYELAVEHAA